MGAWTSKHWEKHFAKATWLVLVRGYQGQDQAVHGLSEFLCTEERVKIPVVHIKNTWGKTAWVIPACDIISLPGLSIFIL